MPQRETTPLRLSGAIVAYLFRREPKGAKGEIISLETSYLSPQIFLVMRTQQKVSPLITGQQQSLV